MVLIKNVTTTSKGNWYLKAHYYTILTKVVDKVTWTCILQLHNKLSSSHYAFKEVNSFPFVCIQCFFQHIKHQIKPNVIPWSTILETIMKKYKNWKIKFQNVIFEHWKKSGIRLIFWGGPSSSPLYSMMEPNWWPLGASW
jgi:hypothetical protein